MRADQWWNLTDQQKLWYMAGLATAAREAADWLQATHGISVPARRLTKATAKQPGFCSHQDREAWFGTPGRRTDPWRNDPVLWDLFLTLYADTAPTTDKGFLMALSDAEQGEVLAAARKTNGTQDAALTEMLKLIRTALKGPTSTIAKIKATVDKIAERLAS